MSSSSATYRVKRSPLTNTRFSEPQTASDIVQKTSGARVSCDPAGVEKPSYAYAPMPMITTAMAGSMNRARESARNAMPSGGVQPPNT